MTNGGGGSGRTDDRGGSEPPIPFQLRRGRLPDVPRARWLVVVVVLIVLYILLTIGKSIYADYLWFDSLGFASVYGKQIVTKVWLFFAGGLVFLAIIWANLRLARSLAPSGLEESFIAEVEPATLRRIASIALVAGSLFFAVVFGSVAAGEWDTYLRFVDGVPFGVKDPAFSHDAGFYVFTLPMLHFIQNWLVGASVVILIAVLMVYAFTLSLQNFEIHLTTSLKAHVGALIIVLLGLIAFGHVLGIFDLAVSKNGVVQGATYTDLHARVPGYFIAMAFELLAAGAVLWSVFRPSITPAAVGLATWLVLLVVVLAIYPSSVQRVTVEPNELAKEQPYISRNITATRAAFGLDNVQEQDFPAESTISSSTIDQNQATVNNIRLWDPRYEIETYRQLQDLQQVYTFDDVDVDRYMLNGAYTEVTLGARELTERNLPPNAHGWVNIHLQYTHGFGAIMNPVNKEDPFGLPVFNLQNIPPAGEPALDQPRIYYGNETTDYVVVGAKQPEFDYSVGNDQHESRYDGSGGVGIGSLLRRLVYAWEFGDSNLLISAQIQSSSKLLYRRKISDRVSHIAPFLTLDNDPYLVVADGKLYWMQDAYTTTANYPYSEMDADGINYIRNSVKIVVDAYTGAVSFYLADPHDPIALAYQRIFPNLLKPLDQMPASLRAHIRYPEDLFRVQAEVYNTYHMTDPRTFYNKQDLGKRRVREQVVARNRWRPTTSSCSFQVKTSRSS